MVWQWDIKKEKLFAALKLSFLVKKLGKAKPVKNDVSDVYKRTDDKKDL